MILQGAYDDLTALRLVKGRAKFSIDFLGRSGRYFDYLSSSGAQPSMAALTTLAMRVTGISDIYREDTRRARQTAILDALADRLWTEIERRSYADAWRLRRLPSEPAAQVEQGGGPGTGEFP